jgi:general L-amino acid transport system permease protein
MSDNLGLNYQQPELKNTEIEEKPPKTSVGVTGWLKKNLFSSWFNVILTVITASALFYILKGAITWILFSAEWAVVSNNYTLIFVGHYPPEQLWRVWLSLAIVSLLFGFSSGIWKGTMSRLSVVFIILLLAHILFPFTGPNAKIWLGINIAAIVVGHFISKFIPVKKLIAIVGWLLSFPLIIFLLSGFDVLPSVATNVWGGLLLTVLISVVAILFSFPIGILLALGRTSKLPIIKWFSIGYIEIIRGVPLITIFFMAQLMVPLFLSDNIEVDNVIRVMIGATMFTAAYMAENVRGGLQSVARGQHEAAKALGLNATLSTIFIILPQALRAVIPAIVGQCISMFKDTSLVAIVGLIDILGIAKMIVANPDFLGKQMEMFLFIGLIYWVISYSMSYASRRIEKNLGVGER